MTPTALLRQRYHGLFKQVPKGLAGDEEAVHQMRVAGRRLRVALAMLAHKPDGRRASRAQMLLRELTRAAGHSRDLDVILGIYEKRLEGRHSPGPGRAALRRRLRGARARGRARMAEALLDLEISRLRRDLRRIVGGGVDEAFVVHLRLREMRTEEGGAVLAGFAQLGGRFDPVALHALRRQARRLRYASEIGDLLTGEDSGAPALWKKLQEKIGTINDHHVLAGWLEAAATFYEMRGRGDLAAAARSERSWAVSRARALHRELIATDPAAIAQHALDAMNWTIVPIDPPSADREASRHGRKEQGARRNAGAGAGRRRGAAIDRTSDSAPDQNPIQRRGSEGEPIAERGWAKRVSTNREQDRGEGPDEHGGSTA